MILKKSSFSKREGAGGSFHLAVRSAFACSVPWSAFTSISINQRNCGLMSTRIGGRLVWPHSFGFVFVDVCGPSLCGSILET
jgi:hypothetical protein